MFINFIRYFHTLRHLKFKQWIYRILLFIPKKKRFFKTAPERSNYKLLKTFFWRNLEYLPNNNFNYLNKKIVFDLKKFEKNKKASLLWLFNLNYFNELNSIKTKHKKKINSQFINRWIKEVKFDRRISWHPYPTSIRIINWIRWDLMGNRLSDFQLCSLASQCDWLYKNIEYHLLGNHIWTNGKALFFAGYFFEGKNSREWITRGSKILKEEIKKQCLNDGGHFERSPMYHSLFIEDIIDLLMLSDLDEKKFNTYLNKDELIRYAEIMITWLGYMTHPNKEISFFNDSTLQIAPDINFIIKYFNLSSKKQFILNQKNLISYHLSESGFLFLKKNKITCLCDVGDIGPSYLPGHAHAETFSFELSYLKKRIIVNSGISKYGKDKERNLQRSTKSHSTLTLNDRNSSDVWGGFRVGKRAKVFDIKKSFSPEIDYFSCCHDGYFDKKNKVIHNRQWILSSNRLEIIDNVKGNGLFNIKINFYFHPDCQLINDTKNSLKIFCRGEGSNSKEIGKIVWEDAMKSKVKKSLWNSGFGLRKKNVLLELSSETLLDCKYVTKIYFI